MSRKTFHDFYLDAKENPTPAQQFIKDIAKVTCKAELTVRRWVDGKVIPDALTKKILADHFKVKPEDLFPVE